MSKFEILLVDDTKDNLLALSALLESDEVNISQAKSGNEALDLMLAIDFGVALLDLQMPDMNGTELAELMRGIKKTKNIPIIFVTGSERHQTNFYNPSIDGGSVDYIQKPLDAEVVKSKVNALIELHHKKNYL